MPRQLTPSVRTKFYYRWEEVPVLMDIPMACCLLGLCENTVRQMLISGELPGFKIGRQWRIERAEVMRMAGLEPI